MNLIKTYAKDIAFKIGTRLIAASAPVAAAPVPSSARIAVDSSFIKSVGFVPTRHYNVGTLLVEYKSGALWAYDDVERGEFDDMTDGRSAGTFLNHTIKPQYVGRLLD